MCTRIIRLRRQTTRVSTVLHKYLHTHARDLRTFCIYVYGKNSLADFQDVHGEENCTGDVTHLVINNPLTAVCLPKKKRFSETKPHSNVPEYIYNIVTIAVVRPFRFFSHYNIETTCYSCIHSRRSRSVTISTNFSKIFPVTITLHYVVVFFCVCVPSTIYVPLIIKFVLN